MVGIRDRFVFGKRPKFTGTAVLTLHDGTEINDVSCRACVPFNGPLIVSFSLQVMDLKLRIPNV